MVPSKMRSESTVITEQVSGNKTSYVIDHIPTEVSGDSAGYHRVVQGLWFAVNLNLERQIILDYEANTITCSVRSDAEKIVEHFKIR